MGDRRSGEGHESFLADRSSPMGDRTIAGSPESADPSDKDQRAPTNLLLIALAWIRARRVRDDTFGERLFSDPAWDMLLDLYISHARRNPVSISDLCLASTAPATTALRYIALLEKRELIYREADPADGRRIHILLTPLGLERIETSLARAAEEDQRLGLARLQTFN